MKLAEIYTEQEEQNGMMIILYLAYGLFMLQAEYHMVLIGITGEQNKRLLGKKTIDFG